MLSDYLYLLLRSPYIFSAALRIGKERSLAGISRPFKKKKIVLNVRAGRSRVAGAANTSALLSAFRISRGYIDHNGNP